MELYRKIYIKSEADLPKEEGKYIVRNKSNGCLVRYYYHFNDQCKSGWLEKVDWYLQPYIITDADIEAWAKHIQEGELLKLTVQQQPMRTIASYLIEGAKAILNNEIKHIENEKN